MPLQYLDTYTVQYLNSDTEKQFPNKEEALEAAKNYVGNNNYSNPFPNADQYLFGPGDGTTSVIVQRDIG